MAQTLKICLKRSSRSKILNLKKSKKRLFNKLEHLKAKNKQRDISANNKAKEKPIIPKFLNNKGPQRKNIIQNMSKDIVSRYGKVRPFKYSDNPSADNEKIEETKRILTNRRSTVKSGPKTNGIAVLANKPKPIQPNV